MNSLTFPDANVWLALAWRRHIHSKRAWEWFDSTSTQKLFFCRMTQISTLRLLTTTAILGAEAHTMTQAWSRWDQVCSNPRVGLLAEPSQIEPAFQRLSSLNSASPKTWMDAYLLAFAETAGLELVTFDRALKGRIGKVRVL